MELEDQLRMAQEQVASANQRANEEAARAVALAEENTRLRVELTAALMQLSQRTYQEAA